MKTICIIPARSGSKGIPGKNVKHIGGRILIDHSIRAARNAGLDLIVSTDSKEYKTKIDSLYPKENYCPFLRPVELARDDTPSADVVLHAINWLEENSQEEYDIVVLLEPTNPVRCTTDITAPLAYFRNQTKYDSLVSVVNRPEYHPLMALEAKKLRRVPDGICELHPHGGKFISIGHPRRQALNDAYYMNGGIYMSWIDKFKVNKMFDVNPCLGWIMPKWRSNEIDEADDIIVAEAFIKRVM